MISRAVRRQVNREAIGRVEEEWFAQFSRWQWGTLADYRRTYGGDGTSAILRQRIGRIGHYHSKWIDNRQRSIEAEIRVDVEHPQPAFLEGLDDVRSDASIDLDKIANPDRCTAPTIERNSPLDESATG